MNNLFRFSLILLFFSSCDDSSDIKTLVLINVEKELDHGICGNEGLRLALGGDINDNGKLENTEVETYTTFCNDQNGDPIFITWTTVENVPTCDGFNGYKIDIGYDLKDNLLDEWHTSFYICVNIDVKNYIINATEISMGGVCGKEYRIEMGHDQNRNSVLDEDEIENSTSFYNRQIVEDNTIHITLSEADYEAIAEAYSESNPEGTENLLMYNSFHGSMWSDEEIQEAIQGRLMEIGSKMDCQNYAVAFERFPGGTFIMSFRYSENSGTFEGRNY